MGLLSQILAGVTGNRVGRSSSGTTGGGASRVLMALLPIVLGMMRNSQRSNNTSQGEHAAGGWGGLGGLLDQFTRKGFGMQASSWVGTGANEPVSPQIVSDVLGEEELTRIAQQAGVSDEEARNGLSELLPDVVDHFTPDGRLPETDQLVSSVDDYLRRLDE